MSGAGREPLHADCATDIEAIADGYLRENDGNPSRALRCVISDALADLLEEGKQITWETPPPLPNPDEQAVSDLIVEKYRKMGFKV